MLVCQSGAFVDLLGEQRAKMFEYEGITTTTRRSREKYSKENDSTPFRDPYSVLYKVVTVATKMTPATMSKSDGSAEKKLSASVVIAHADWIGVLETFQIAGQCYSGDGKRNKYRIWVNNDNQVSCSETPVPSMRKLCIDEIIAISQSCLQKATVTDLKTIIGAFNNIKYPLSLSDRPKDQISLAKIEAALKEFEHAKKRLAKSPSPPPPSPTSMQNGIAAVPAAAAATSTAVQQL